MVFLFTIKTENPSPEEKNVNTEYHYAPATGINHQLPRRFGGDNGRI
jgi:hypothetical protein